MGKRTSDGEERPPTDTAGPKPAKPAGSTPQDLFLVDFSPIVSTRFRATHIGSDGTVVFQSEAEIVVANLNDGSIRGRYNPTDMFVHGVVETTCGRSGVCMSAGDDIVVMSTSEAPDVVYSRTMPVQTHKGYVAVVDSVIFVMKENAVVLICPFYRKETLWIAPAPVSNLISDRSLIPTIVTGVETDVKVWTLVPETMEVVPYDCPLEMPLCTLAADSAIGVGVIAVMPDTGLLSLSPAYPAFSNLPLLVSPVSASWTAKTVYVLGSASGMDDFPAVYALMPSLGMITGIFHPNKTRIGEGADPDPETNCIRGRFVLWQGQPYILASLE